MLLSIDACAQSYPNKPLRMVTAEAGGGADFSARLIAQALSAQLGQQMIVDNRGGAGGIIAIETVAKASPDGYTLLLYSDAVWLIPFLRRNVSWDPLKDFAPITLADRSPSVLAVHPSVPAKSVKELIALAKARPGEINYGSGGTGSTNYLAVELFKALAGVDIVHIPYKGAGPAINALIANQVQMMIATAASLAPHIKSGRLTALAVASPQPSELLPGVPTVSSGLPGYEAGTVHAVYAPAATSKPIISRLQREIAQFMTRPEVKERFLNAGLEVVASTPEALASAMKSDMARMGKVIRDAGIRAD